MTNFHSDQFPCRNMGKFEGDSRWGGEDLVELDYSSTLWRDERRWAWWDFWRTTTNA